MASFLTSSFGSSSMELSSWRSLFLAAPAIFFLIESFSEEIQIAF